MRLTWHGLLLGGVCICLLCSCWAFAETNGILSSDKAKRADSILVNVSEECGAEETELMALEGLVQDYCASSLNSKTLEAVLVKAHDMGCENICMVEVARCIRDGVEKGIPAAKATAVAERSIVETKSWCDQLGIPLNDSDFATRMRIRFKGYTASK